MKKTTQADNRFGGEFMVQDQNHMSGITQAPRGHAQSGPRQSDQAQPDVTQHGGEQSGGQQGAGPRRKGH